MERHLAGFVALLTLAALIAFWPLDALAGDRPNIVLIYADDVGYGDVGCYGAKTIPTPNIDRLAREGLRFTSGYSSSATCTPSRYSLLTGEYAWRRKDTGIAPPNATAIIEPGRTTLASILQQAGYRTAIVGKWHLGLGRPPKPNWSGTIQPGPLEVGFDYSFILPTTNDRVPCVYIENHHVVNLDPNDPLDVFDVNPDGQPTGRTQRNALRMDWWNSHNDSIVNGISRIGFMTGGHAARWIDEDMADKFVGKAKDFISHNRDQPFFLFYSAHEIHAPRTPHSRFVGKTPHGPRGDFLVEFDWCVGEILGTLDEMGLLENTLVILTSDNGPVLRDGYKDGAIEKAGNHRPAGPWRGGKYSIFEGGTRVPWIVRWPTRVKPGVSNAIVCQVDLLASLGKLLDPTKSLPVEAAPDSLDVLAALLGESETGRDYVILQANTLALRQGPWKFIDPSSGPSMQKSTNTELGNDPSPKLYNLETDPGEECNLAATYPNQVEQMANLLEKLKRQGRSRP